jgi:hypothetical protein
MFQWELLLRLKAGMEGAAVWALVVLIWPITELSALRRKLSYLIDMMNDNLSCQLKFKVKRVNVSGIAW